MKVFISWSGKDTASHQVALALHDWLPCVNQNLKPFVSSEDIQKGDRGLAEIEKALEGSGFGILCVTKDNYKAPWLLFEAGALSNNPKKVPVTPFLFGLNPSDLTGSPITQFQATAYSSKDDIYKLMQSLNKTCGEGQIPEDLLKKTFETFYSELGSQLVDIQKRFSSADKKPTEEPEIDKNRAILEEILSIVRSSQTAISGAVMSDAIIDRIARKVVRIEAANREEATRDALTHRTFNERKPSLKRSPNVAYPEIKNIVDAYMNETRSKGNCLDDLRPLFSSGSLCGAVWAKNRSLLPSLIQFLDSNDRVNCLQELLIEIDGDFSV